MEKIPRSFGTHDGTFHADEVTACALLRLFNLIDPDKIIRTRSLEALEACDFVCDVGGTWEPEKKRFDHHQVDYRGHLSSAGMILEYLRSQKIITHADFDFLNNSLVRGVDAHDNGKETAPAGLCTFSHIISNFTPISYEATSEEQNAAFFEAQEFATGHIRRMWERYKYTHSCREEVIKAMAEYRDCLIFDTPIPWMDTFFEQDGAHHPAKFVIMPSGRYWKLRGIPPTADDKMRVRQPLPEEWAGMLDADLKRLSGIDGAIFCHKGRFISVWATKEDAIRAYEKVQEMTKK